MKLSYGLVKNVLFHKFTKFSRVGYYEGPRKNEKCPIKFHSSAAAPNNAASFQIWYCQVPLHASLVLFAMTALKRHDLVRNNYILSHYVKIFFFTFHTKVYRQQDILDKYIQKNNRSSWRDSYILNLKTPAYAIFRAKTNNLLSTVHLIFSFSLFWNAKKSYSSILLDAKL